MVIKHASNFVKFLKTTAIGGLLFLLPLIVIGALIGQIAPIVMAIAETLHQYWPPVLQTPGGIALLIILSIAILLALCFAAGLLARRSLFLKLSRAFERRLAFFFPRYTILKDQMADSIGGDENKPQMKPVVIRFNDSMQIGFETERDEQTKMVIVFVPGSPDPWTGKAMLVQSDRVQSLDVEFGDAVSTCEQLGRGTSKLILKGTAAIQSH